MRALVLIHRWLGVALCLFFAMWFASGMVMHFVPFPAFGETARVAGLAPFQVQDIAIAPRAALKALDVHKVWRMRLVAVGGKPVYIAMHSDHTLAALDAGSGKPIVVDQARALASASAHARMRGLDASQTHCVATERYDQWTIGNGFDAHRPLYRVALEDAAHTELYVSSVTGEVVLDTTRTQRAWNWVGTVSHWIYPTILRKHWQAWDFTVWWLSLIALTGALAGAVLGVSRLRRWRSPFGGWMRWHHWLGLGCGLFVLTWIFSGWLSMDHGLMFSTGAATGDDRMRIEGRALSVPDLPELEGITAPVREVEWFPFAGQVVTRITGLDGNRELRADQQRSAWLADAQLTVAARILGTLCTHARIAPDDAYLARSITDGAPVFRVICGNTWYHIDGADGQFLEKLDASRRAYRWAFQALHTLDFPFLMQRPVLRTALIVALCVAGFAFSVTGTIIAWRRLRRSRNDRNS